MGLTDGAKRGSSTDTLMGIPMKQVSLVTLTIQNSALILILYYSRVMPLAGGQRYITSTAVFLNEVLKLGVCLSIALYDLSRNLSPSSTAASLFSTLITAVFTGDSWKLAIPALLYTLQNSLQYVAISNLDVATLQVTYQFKIIPTAIFSILLLRRSISGRKWVALVLLVFGVAIVQIPAARSGSLNLVKDMQSRIYFPRSADDLRNLGGLITAPLHKRSATYDGMHEDLLLSQPNQNKALGLVAAICSCTASALGSVFFEKILKESHTNVSIWVRNVQLAVYSIFPALFIGVIFVDGELVAKSGFLVGYNWVVWTTITFQALGGILVALCVHYADNIAKTFATSISILLSLVFSILFFGFALTSNFLFGTSLVMFSTYLYNRSERSPPPPPIRIHQFEKTIVSLGSGRPRDIAVKGPTTPLTNKALSTSRPGSPLFHHARGDTTKSYFAAKHRDD